WTNPDGMSWVEMLTDEAKIKRHACLTPIWSETAWFADFVLPMGHASERHDLMSQETHAARWIGFRQPVLRVMLERQGRTFDITCQAHEAVGLVQVWEEDEFWIELSWRIDPDGSLGVRKYFESPYRPGQKLRAEEVYRWIFERSVPGLPDAAAREGLTPLAYMRKYGAFLVEDQVYRTHEQPLSAGELDGARARREPRCAEVLRVALSSGPEASGRGGLPLDLRAERPRPPRRGGAGGAHAARLHAEVRRVPRRGSGLPDPRAAALGGRARRRPRGSGHARGRQGRPGGRPRGGRRGTARLSDAVPEARVLLADAQGVEVARGGRAELHPEPRALVGDRS